MPETNDTGVQLISRGLVGEVLEKARQSPRRRMNHNFHGSMAESVHRFLNVFLRGSYLTPHRHVHPPKPETFLALEGKLAFWEFDDQGTVIRTALLGWRQEDPEATVWGVDVAPGVWHTVAALTDYAVCFEIKPGPYDPIDDKDFAPWAPREGDAAAPGYLQSLLHSLPGA